MIILDPKEFYKTWGFWPMAGGAPEDGEGEPDPGSGDAPDPGDSPEDKKIEVSEKEYSELKGFKEKAGEDFDPEKWSKLKGFDPNKVAENMEFGSAVEKDAMVQAILKERIDAARAGRKMNMAKIMETFKDELETGGDKAKKPNEEKSLDPEVKYLLEKDQRETEEKIVREFSDRFDKEITAQKLKLSGREKAFLNKLVQEVYIGDHKLGFDAMSKIVKEQMKEVLEYRKELQSQWNKEISGDAEKEGEEAPEHISGPPSIPAKRAYDPKKATSSQRTEAIANEMKSMGYGN